MYVLCDNLIDSDRLGVVHAQCPGPWEVHSVIKFILWNWSNSWGLLTAGSCIAGPDQWPVTRPSSWWHVTMSAAPRVIISQWWKWSGSGNCSPDSRLALDDDIYCQIDRSRLSGPEPALTTKSNLLSPPVLWTGSGCGSSVNCPVTHTQWLWGELDLGRNGFIVSICLILASRPNVKNFAKFVPLGFATNKGIIEES